MEIQVKHYDYSHVYFQTDDINLTKRILLLFEAEILNKHFDPRVKSGVWDGIVRFYTIKNKTVRIPFGFVNFLKDFCNSNSIKYTDVNEFDFKEDFNKVEFDEFVYSLNLKYEPRDYQMEAAHIALRDNNGLFQLATGAGKSLTQSFISAYLAFKKDMKVLIIVPSVSLVHQFYSDMEEYFENTSAFTITDELHKIYAGQEKTINKKITISTWQSLRTNLHLIEEFDCIIVDEVQGAKNKDGILTKIMVECATKVKYKFGFTGTIPRERINKLNLVGNFGKVNKIINARGLIERGFGTPMDIICMFLDWPDDMRQELPNDYQREVKIVEESPTRNRYIVDLCSKVTKKFGTTLALFSTISHGEELVNLSVGEGRKFLPKLTKMKLERLLDEFPCTKTVLVNIEPSEKALKQAYKVLDSRGIDKEGFFETLEDNGIFFVYGKVESLEREEIRKKVESKPNSIIFASYATFSTGINIKSLSNLILCSSTKSYERLIQSLGRTIRTHSSKSKVRIFDLIDDIRSKRRDNKLFKHFLERIEMYRDEGHPIYEKTHKLG